MVTLTVKVKLPWWHNMYIKSLVTFSKTMELLGFDVEPDYKRAVDKIIKKSKITSKH